MKKMFILVVLMFACTVKGEGKVQSDPYSSQEKQYLLNLARATLFSYLHDRSLPKIDESALPTGLTEKRGCFVTLEKHESLRGCIGYIQPVEKLYEGIVNRAIAAATQDPRFPKVTYQELQDIKIEISILTLPEEIKVANADELLARLTPLQDGVVLRTPYGTSTFLPQVWEQLPDKEEFLNHLCMKQGAPANTWRDTGRIAVSIYHAIVFSEDQEGRLASGSKGAAAGPKGAEITGSAVWGKTVEQKKVPAGEPIEPLAILSPDSDVIQK